MIKPITRISDPETSHLAEEAVTKTRFQDVCQAIMSAFDRTAYPKPIFTDEEIYRALYQWERERWSDRTVRHGRAELVRQGILEEYSERKRNKRGRLCRAYRKVD